jgi:hypothetical protein
MSYQDDAASSTFFDLKEGQLAMDPAHEQI